MADMIESFLTASPQEIQAASPSALSMHQNATRSTLQRLRQEKEEAEKKAALLERRVEQLERSSDGGQKKPRKNGSQRQTVCDDVEERLSRLERDVAYIMMKAVNALDGGGQRADVEAKPRDPETLLSEVASRLGVNMKEVLSRSREDRIVLARKIFTILARGAFPWVSLKEVGRILGRDHSSVISGIRTVVKNPRHFDQAVSIGRSLGIPVNRLLEIRQHYLEEKK